MRLLEGETVVDLDPDLIDGSFVSDRMEDDDEAFAELVAAIRRDGGRTADSGSASPCENGRYRSCSVTVVLAWRNNLASCSCRRQGAS